MANLVRNAAFLDGATNWTPLASNGLLVDDATLGGPGRAVLAALTSTDGQLVGMASDPFALTSATAYEVNVLIEANVGAALVWLERVGGSSPNVFLPPVRPPSMLLSRGLSQGFGFYGGRLSVSATGNWRLVAVGDAATVGARRLTIRRPLVTLARADSLPRPFDPGQHTNADLNLPVWPAALRPFRNPITATPVPNRMAFQNAAGVNRTRLMYREPPTDIRGQVRCTADEMDALQAFHDSGVDRFWIVRPDTDQLCVASWMADGMPKPVEYRGPTTIVEVGLQLSLA